MGIINELHRYLYVTNVDSDDTSELIKKADTIMQAHVIKVT